MEDRVLIQKDRGEFVNANGFTAWKGFDERGYAIAFCEWDRMREGAVALDPGTVVVGSVAFVRSALGQLCIRPRPIDYPPVLSDYLGREVWRTTLGDIRAGIDRPGVSLFVKPVEDDKAFPGHMVSAFRDLIRTAGHPAAMAVWASEACPFTSEWRYFVHRGEIVGVGHYKGDPLQFPDARVVRGAVAAFADASPIAYGIDFGVDETGRTLLVEVNDGFSLGCYGLGPLAYSKLLIDRWRELTGRPRDET